MSHVLSTPGANEAARTATSRILHAAQSDYDRYRTLIPATAGEHLLVAAACSAVACAFDRAARIWRLHRPGGALARRYTELATTFQARAAVAELSADLAAASAGR